MSREEAAAKAVYGHDYRDASYACNWEDASAELRADYIACETAALAAADAHDAANGIHRIALDDATVEMCIRVARGAEPSSGMYYREAEPIVRAILDALREASDA